MSSNPSPPRSAFVRPGFIPRGQFRGKGLLRIEARSSRIMAGTTSAGVLLAYSNAQMSAPHFHRYGLGCERGRVITPSTSTGASMLVHALLSQLQRKHVSLLLGRGLGWWIYPA